MSTIMLSIKPKYVQQIINNTKTVELRRTLPRKMPKKIYVYETHPTMKVVAELEIEGIITEKIDTLWQLTKNNNGIKKEDFFNYFNDKEYGHAYKIKSVTKINKKLDEFGLKNPPQSFVYINN